jgi:hypothetical protein
MMNNFLLHFITTQREPDSCTFFKDLHISKWQGNCKNCDNYRTIWKIREIFEIWEKILKNWNQNLYTL